MSLWTKITLYITQTYRWNKPHPVVFLLTIIFGNYWHHSRISILPIPHQRKNVIKKTRKFSNNFQTLLEQSNKSTKEKRTKNKRKKKDITYIKAPKKIKKKKDKVTYLRATGLKSKIVNNNRSRREKKKK